MKFFRFLFGTLRKIARYMETTEMVVLRKYIRVIESEVVTFKIVKKKWKYLGGALQICHNMVIDDYDRDKIPIDNRYCIDIGVEAARTSILAANWVLMVDHTTDWDS